MAFLLVTRTLDLLLLHLIWSTFPLRYVLAFGTVQRDEAAHTMPTTLIRFDQY